MGNGIYIALSGAVAQSNALDVVANNVANADTTGFRGHKVAFGEVLAAARGGAQAAPDSAYSVVSQIATDDSAGAIVQTGNPLDLALAGDGYFAIESPRGVRYTRAGAFTLSSQGEIVDAQGNPARASGGGAVVIPPGTQDVEIEKDGTVLADGQPVGTLELVRFADGALAREGTTLYAALPGARPVAGNPEVVSGALEKSNVNGVRGVVDLVKVSRTYEALLTAIDTYRGIDARAARDIGGPK